MTEDMDTPEKKSFLVRTGFILDEKDRLGVY